MHTEIKSVKSALRFNFVHGAWVHLKVELPMATSLIMYGCSIGVVDSAIRGQKLTFRKLKIIPVFYTYFQFVTKPFTNT